MVLALGPQPGCALTGKVEESGAEGSPRSRRNTGKAQVVPETVASEQGDQQSSRERRKDREWGKVEAAMMPHPVIPPTHTQRRHLATAGDTVGFYIGRAEANGIWVSEASIVPSSRKAQNKPNKERRPSVEGKA